MTARIAFATIVVSAALATSGWSQWSERDELSDVEPFPLISAASLDETSRGPYFPNCSGIDRDPGYPAKPRFQRPGDIHRGSCPPKRYRMDGEVRAGRPQWIAPWARCTTSPKYSGGFIGVGATFGGRVRHTEEGTWGVDYQGLLSPRHVFLNWTCGLEQGGEGAYRTDGEPRVVALAKERFDHAEHAKD